MVEFIVGVSILIAGIFVYLLWKRYDSKYPKLLITGNNRFDLIAPGIVRLKSLSSSKSPE